MNEGASGALAVWDAIRPKIEQLIREKTNSAVRQKKMNVYSVDTANQTVTVYDGEDTDRRITIPYRAGSGVDLLTNQNSVLVEWMSDDLSTAVATEQGRGWTNAVGALPGATTGYFQSIDVTGETKAGSLIVTGDTANVRLLGARKEIQNGADLNSDTYKYVGCYALRDATYTVSNAPRSGEAFILDVENANGQHRDGPGEWRYIRQRVIYLEDTTEWFRNLSSDGSGTFTYSKWVQAGPTPETTSLTSATAFYNGGPWLYKCGGSCWLTNDERVYIDDLSSGSWGLLGYIPTTARPVRDVYTTILTETNILCVVKINSTYGSDPGGIWIKPLNGAIAYGTSIPFNISYMTNGA